MQTSLLPWQNTQWRQIESQAVQQVLPHAYLFNGIKGIGKRGFANHLAAWLLCESREGSKPCGVCKQCKLIEADTHSDLKFVGPEEGSRVIKVDAIRALSDFVAQSSNQGGLKVAIINPAEALNVNAANALLKTLEEPTPNTLIILVSHVSGQLLATIRSRCQIVDFAKPGYDQSVAWLADKGLSGNEGNALLELAAGAPLEALKLQEVDSLAEHEAMLGELGGVLKRELSPSQVAERWADDMAGLRLSWMNRWLEVVTRSKFVAIEGKSGSQKMFEYIRDKASNEELFALYDEGLKQQRLLQGSSNPNKTLLFEHLFQGWINLIRN